jgi:dimethylhistidine N-methyltransferase
MSTPTLLDQRPDLAQFRADVLRGLRRRHKRLPCKYFYDEAGSRLFDEICRLPEYYPTRTELGILQASADAMAARIGPRAALIEYGSGSSIKTRLLLRALERPAAYVPVDISREHLLTSAARLAADFPRIAIHPVCADFTQEFPLPEELPPGARRVVYFPGSTIGNFGPRPAQRLLRGMARLVGPGGAALIGTDLKKDPRILERAYDDAAGVTAAFNQNLLIRINRELDGTFDPDDFRHHALYHPRAGRIEMHLVSRRRHTVMIGGETIHFQDGESIHTENSYKFSIEDFQNRAARAGLQGRAAWTDPHRWFCVHYLVAP